MARVDFPAVERAGGGVRRLDLRVLPVVCFLMSCLIGVTVIATNAYPGAFDELEHVSYAAFLQETGRLLPKFELQRTLVVDDMSRWNDRANYLGHPSPFYVFESLFLDRTLAPDQAILLPRLSSAGLLFLGLGFSLWAGWRHFRTDRCALSLFCLLLALCPKMLAVAGQVTNDSLAFLGGALAYAGVSMLARRYRMGLGAVALGLALALWAKPNAGLIVGVWLGVYFIIAGRPAGLLRAVSVGGVIGLVPYWFMLRDYGAVVPVTVEQFGGVRQASELAEYVPAFLLIMGSTWSFSQTGTWPMGPATFVAAALFWLMIGGAAWGGVSAWGRASGNAMAAAAPIALALVVPIHFWFAATRLGYSLPAASFRYYLPLWPALAHALAYGAAATRPRLQRLGIASISLATLAIGWISP